MGLFDTLEAEMECLECGLEATRRIQFKHPGHRLETYEIGDFVQGVPAGRPLLRTSFTCPGIEPDTGEVEENEDDTGSPAGSEDHRVDCWIHVDRGFLTDVTADKPERPTPLASWMIERAGWNAQERERNLRGVAATVRKRRETIEAEQAGELPPEDEAEPFLELHRIRSEEELLDTLEAKLERVDERSWPRG